MRPAATVSRFQALSSTRLREDQAARTSDPPHASIPSKRCWIVWCNNTCNSVGGHFHGTRWLTCHLVMHSSDRQALADSQTPPGRHLAHGKLGYEQKLRLVTTWPTTPLGPSVPTSAGPRLFPLPTSADCHGACGTLGPPGWTLSSLRDTTAALRLVANSRTPMLRTCQTTIRRWSSSATLPLYRFNREHLANTPDVDDFGRSARVGIGPTGTKFHNKDIHFLSWRHGPHSDSLTMRQREFLSRPDNGRWRSAPMCALGELPENVCVPPSRISSGLARADRQSALQEN